MCEDPDFGLVALLPLGFVVGWLLMNGSVVGASGFECWGQWAVSG